MKRAVVLLSGGLDSTTTLALAIAEGFEAYSLSFDYGQRHKIEIDAARRVAKSLGAKEHRVAKIDNDIFGGSALTSDVDVPKARSEAEIMRGIPITYVPARNTVFLSHALAWAEVVGALDIFIGVNALDYDLSLTHSCYDPLPDGRACGQCDSCQLRRKGFREAGVNDPIEYATS